MLPAKCIILVWKSVKSFLFLNLKLNKGCFSTQAHLSLAVFIGFSFDVYTMRNIKQLRYASHFVFIMKEFVVYVLLVII